jgi:serine/threonine protein kinase
MLHADLVALVGATLHDRYRVESLLGSGGMGAVFKGHHTGLGRDVAIKVLHPEFGRDPSVGKRFEREATSASRLDHPNCVRVTDFGTTETGTTYLVMELLSGTELQARLGQPWAPRAMIATAKQVLAGLEHAHHFGIVHRDLKPENVYVTKDYRGEEVVKLVDFGIAKLLDEQGVEKLTRQGVVFGTPRYMSPEQAAGGKIDERTDLYAAGLIFYEMLAGHGPFDTEDTAQVLRMQIMEPPPPLPESVPAPLAKVIEKLLEKSKSDRYANARDVIAALDEALVVLDATPVLVPSASMSARSGAAWQPASASTSATGGHRTVAYAGGYVATRTGSHSGVGQSATGQYESLSGASWTGSHPSLSAPEPSASMEARAVPIVTMEVIDRRPPPPARRTWLPLAIAGGVLALAGVVVILSLVSSNDPPTDTGTPMPDTTKALPDAAGGAPGSLEPAPGPTHTTAPTRATKGAGRSKSPSNAPAEKSTDRAAVQPIGPSDEPTPSDTDEPAADSKPSNEPIPDPPDNPTSPSDSTEPTGDAAELAKRWKGKGKPKGKDK